MNLLAYSYVIWRHMFGSILAQVMLYGLSALIRYPNQCWFPEANEAVNVYMGVKHLLTRRARVV